MMQGVAVADDLAAVFRSAGARGHMHARPVDDVSVEVGVDADAPVVTASRRTAGPTGLSVMLADVEVSWRDLAFWCSPSPTRSRQPAVDAAIGRAVRLAVDALRSA